MGLNRHRRLRFYIYTFILFAFLNLIVTYNIYSKIRDNYIEDKLLRLSFQYQTIEKELKERGDIYFEESINNSDILKDLNNIDNRESWDSIREKLIEKLSLTFKRMREKNVRQFHFHTKDSISFLRMHKTGKFGDSLKGIRYSVEATNRDLESHHGFEEGKMYNGFRNVYPIIYRGKHLGSVEISFSFKAINNAMNNVFDEDYKFIILKTIVENRVKNIEENYEISLIDDNFYSEKNYIKLNGISKIIDNILKNSISDKLSKGKDFSTFVDTENYGDYIVSFLSIKNIENRSVAYIVNYAKDDFTHLAFYNLVLYSILANIFAIFVIILLMKYIKKGEFSFINAILENQTDIMFIQKADKIIQVNHRFLSFFKVKSVDELISSENSICDFFLKEENYIYREKEGDKCFFINTLNEEPDKIKKVKIVDPYTKVSHIFNVNVSYLEEQELHLVMLSDVTPSEFEKKAIEDKANRDKLTDTYNLSKFKIDLKKNVLEHSTFSLILISIDNFRKLNDEFGHMTGDKILIDFSTLVNQKIRKGDILYRLSDKKFIVMVDDRMLDSTSIAEKLRGLINKHRFFKEIPITASFGVTEYRKFENVEDITNRVNEALLKSKELGKNQVITS